MNKEEREEIARQIASYEMTISHSRNRHKIQQAEDAIISLTTQIEDINDFVAIDEMVQDLLKYRP